MASSYPFSSSSIFIDSSYNNVTITDEDFKNFHSIDRELFLRLVGDIGHEPRQATHFMALFLWFEKTAKDLTIVSKLLQWPHSLLSDFTNEASLVFTCIDSTNCLTKNNVNFKYFDLPLTQKITNSGISLPFVHQNRVGIKQAIMELMNNVCERAFDDIIVQYLLLQKKAFSDNAGLLLPPNVVAPPQARPLNRVVDGGLGGDAFDVRALERKDNFVAVDDRTIFLTFSKGYPISEPEIREFFCRRYGDVVEAVIMQEVTSVGEQPLYARMVLRPQFIHIMEAILEGTTSKSKFCINGKHLWARKYVRKTSKSPPTTSAATSLPNDPFE